MPQATEDLAGAIASAERERKVWNEGRLAYRAEGTAALNPYSPRTQEHALWTDGWDLERTEAAERRRVSSLQL